MKNTDLWQISKAYFGSAAFFTLAGEGMMFLAERYNYIQRADYLLPLVGAFSIPALPFGFYLAARVAHLTQPPEKPGPRWPAPTSTALANVSAWVLGQPKPIPNQSWGLSDTDQPTTTIRYKEPNRVEFVFYEQGMRSQISESRLYAFCKTAWRRQQQVLYGDLAANRVFSRAYFTTEARPRYPLPDYASIVHILDTRQLIINRYKGGELFYAPGITVEEARRRWSLPPERW